jgi:hypothetical protein
LHRAGNLKPPMLFLSTKFRQLFLSTKFRHSTLKRIVTRTEGGVCLEVTHIFVKKGKAIPLQSWTGPEVCRNLRLPDFKTIGTGRW